MRNHRALLPPLVALLTMTIGVTAAIGPVRKGLRIQPIEAPRDESCGTQAARVRLGPSP